MPRQRASRASVDQLFASLPHPGEQEMAASASRYEQLMASVRGDYGGTPTGMLSIPTTYQMRVLRIWDSFNTDPLFGRMVNRTVEFAANGFNWEVPGVPGSKDTWSWWDRAKDWWTGPGAGAKFEKEEEFWTAWSTNINRGAPNVIPGLHEITTWCARHLLLSGMFVPAWQLGTMRLGKQTYIVPTTMTCYPASAIQLRRENSLFMEETIAYRKPPIVGPLVDGYQTEATPAAIGGAPDMVTLPLLGKDKQVGQTAAFALKFHWSPGDLTTLRSGQISTTGQGVYPQPPFFSLLPQFLIRQKLFASDIAMLDGILNYILLWKIGDKDTPLDPGERSPNGTVVRESTIAKVKELLQAGRIGPAIEMFVPYYVSLDIKMPDTAVLLSETKYIQSTLEILQAFGIMFARSTSGSRERMERINITNFEEFLNSIRRYIAAFVGLMTYHIVQLNPGKLSMPPVWTPNPINTKNDAWLAQLFNLSKIGKVSLRTLLRNHGLDPDVEVRRIAGELASDVDDLTNANAPVSYVQTTTDGEAPDVGRNPSSAVKPKPGATKPTKEKPSSKTTRQNPASQPGRPKKGLTRG